MATITFIPIYSYRIPNVSDSMGFTSAREHTHAYVPVSDFYYGIDTSHYQPRTHLNA